MYEILCPLVWYQLPPGSWTKKVAHNAGALIRLPVNTFPLAHAFDLTLRVSESSCKKYFKALQRNMNEDINHNIRKFDSYKISRTRSEHWVSC